MVINFKRKKNWPEVIKSKKYDCFDYKINICYNDKYSEQEVIQYLDKIINKIDFNKEIEKYFKIYIKDVFGNISRNKVTLDNFGSPKFYYNGNNSGELNFDHFYLKLSYDEESGKFGIGNDNFEEKWYICFTLNNMSISKVEYDSIG